MSTTINPITDNEVREALDTASDILKEYLSEFTTNFTDANSIDNWYKPFGNSGWTSGFRTGCYWLAFEHTGEQAFKNAGKIQSDSFYDRVVNKIEIDHHDMGFLYTPSCVAAYKLTGDEKAKKAGIMAADALLNRFQEKGEFLQAWGKFGEAENYRYIIDCMLNLPILYWATEVTGDEKYKAIALKHTATSFKNSIREDGSNHHTFFMNPETGEPVRGETCQGYSNKSAWARGQAWAVYGIALSYKYTKNAVCLELFDRVYDFYVGKLPEDLVPYWDLIFTSGDEPRDSSSAAITACGLLEMAKYVPAEKADNYVRAARQMMKSLTESYAVKDKTKSNGLLMHGTYGRKSPYNTCSESGVDECVAWGDYFYMEALTRLSADWELYW